MSNDHTDSVAAAVSAASSRNKAAETAAATERCLRQRLPVSRIVILVIILGSFALGAPPTTAPTVGMEGRVQIHLPGTLLNARPVTEKAPLILRIASATVGPNGGFYDLRYIGMVPGDHDLKNYLVRADGSATTDLLPIPVIVAPLLPEDHNGQLVRTPGAAWPFFGGYRAMIIAVVLIWILLLVPLMIAGRKRRIARAFAEVKRPPTLADKLRPFIERAATGVLSPDEQSALERLLLSHWQRRLRLTEVNPSEAIGALRADPQAGELLRTLENWLHRPPGVSNAKVDVAMLLAPYGDGDDELIATPFGRKEGWK